MSNQFRTYIPAVSELESQWHELDASGQILGRLASEVARRLRGKHKRTFTPHLDTGDHVIVINAEKVVLSGRKEQMKRYHWHSQYPGGLKSRSFTQMRSEQPERVIRLAVWGMLPKNRLGRKLLNKLKVYAGGAHPHQAQRPVVLELQTRKG